MSATTPSHRPRIAAIVTAYYPRSHAQHIVDRFLEGYGWVGRHHQPAMDLVSMYVDQRGEHDVSGDRAARFEQLQLYDTIEAALTCGGKTLAVDGVLLVGEHGDYPRDDYGRRFYPRYDFFKRIVDVFEQCGRAVPVFNDKHLSWDWQQAVEMYETAQRMGFALMAGSSLPVTPRVPAVDVPLAGTVEEAMCVSYGEIDSYDFHALETLQCMVERRAGGETGVQWIEAKRGEAVWEALERGDFSSELLETCLARCDELTLLEQGDRAVFPTREQMKRAASDPIMYRYRHHDGLQCTMLLLNGLVGGWTFAARLQGRSEPLSTRLHLRMPVPRKQKGNKLATFFSPLVYWTEQLFLTGRSPLPIERTLLTTGLTAAGVQSLGDGQVRLDTPHLNVTYQAPVESQFEQC